ncbi:hypothetical protein DSO57_1022495 [Entomophthora muscae]|uniref:Uncharacterized protein n=1 Tax=Entomophthora muscae TaxID=34485 RepID=A0ACC2UPR8_9FUNG|nr:hypothetical protein DSO57_1022495 [Entomophthora muscae]
MPQAGINPTPSHQAGLVGGGDSPAPGFLLFKVNPGVGPILGPKSYAQALMGLAGPGQAIFSCLSGLTILLLWKPRPKSGNQTQNLDSPGPMDCGTACPHFSGVKPPQADAEDDGPPSETY